MFRTLSVIFVLRFALSLVWSYGQEVYSERNFKLADAA